MSDMFKLKFPKASLLFGATGATAQGLGDMLERRAPGFASLQRFFSRWLRIDLATLVLLISFGGDIPNAMAGLQKLGTSLYWWITRFFTASISVASNDKLNREVLNWLGSQVLTRQGTRILTAQTEVVQNDTWYDRKPVERDDVNHEKRVPVHYLPTFGTTWFLFKGGFFTVRRVPSRFHGAKFGVPDEYSAAPQGDEPLVVMRLGRSAEPIKAFLDHCRDHADKQRESFITVRATKTKYGQESWDATVLRPIRPLETVHFDDAAKRALVADIRSYLDTKTRSFYIERGIPYRRGYLLYGPPGTGKTSLALALAGRFSLELYLVHIPSIRGDGDLENLFTALPPKCIVLLEDIDAVGIERRRRLGLDQDSDDDDEESAGGGDDEGSERSFARCRCTLSGLLNVLDGVASQEGRIVLMTSNAVNKLDKALIRPGRIDRMIYLGNISQQSAKGMFQRMYRPQKSAEEQEVLLEKNDDGAVLRRRRRRRREDEIDALADGFSKEIPDEVFTPAQLQGYLLKYRSGPEEAAERIAEWVVDEQRVMDDARRRKKEAAARLARRKKTLKMKALKAFAKDQDKDAAAADDAGKKIKAESKTNGTDGAKTGQVETSSTAKGEKKKVNGVDGPKTDAQSAKG
ncbi:putative mitochondrial chaperone BCS1-B [Colletotrichum sidae]|uniref:Putative mitochondrial chaperone BCS1-B n=1 Tax=Colletotrichum sidae TaxID=1347389 RepID=A0A4R8T2G6_9PEZI|nr:putative mitochondrial chaperone BCS1-B [Colletotrichum sidae]